MRAPQLHIGQKGKHLGVIWIVGNGGWGQDTRGWVK
jgi:hypothetical protein